MELFPVRLPAPELGRHSRGTSLFVAIILLPCLWANGKIVLNRQASPKITLTALNVGTSILPHTDMMKFFSSRSPRLRSVSQVSPILA